MAKTIFLLGILMTNTMFVSAQCIEVKSVETRKVDTNTEKGFEFNNLNNYTVTMEVELRVPAYAASAGVGSFSLSVDGVSYFTIDTKSFVLEAKEKYLWETLLKARIHSNLNFEANTYVVFKAFKCQE